MDKLKKNSKIKTTEVLSDSKFFNEKDLVKFIRKSFGQPKQSEEEQKDE